MYGQHMNNVAASLLVRFFSHFTLRLHGTQCDLHSYGVIMENIFPVESSCIAETYDLKGSTYKRFVMQKYGEHTSFTLLTKVHHSFFITYGLTHKHTKQRSDRKRKETSG